MAKFFGIGKRMTVQDPHEALLGIFEHDREVPVLSEGTSKEVKLKSLGFLILLFIIRNSVSEYIPKTLDFVLMVVVGFLTVEILFKFFKHLNRRVKKESILGIVRSAAFLTVIILIFAVFNAT